MKVRISKEEIIKALDAIAGDWRFVDVEVEAEPIEEKESSVKIEELEHCHLCGEKQGIQSFEPSMKIEPFDYQIVSTNILNHASNTFSVAFKLNELIRAYNALSK